jgi:hypothetical protein
MARHGIYPYKRSKRGPANPIALYIRTSQRVYYGSNISTNKISIMAHYKLQCRR